MLNYGKIEEGALVYAPLNLEVDGRLICNVNRKPDVLIALGYKPVRISGTPTFDEETGEETAPVLEDRGDYISAVYPEPTPGAEEV